MWQDQDWDNSSNVTNITKIKWMLSTPVGIHTANGGSDTVGLPDGTLPDTDAGILIYKVIIK